MPTVGFDVEPKVSVINRPSKCNHAVSWGVPTLVLESRSSTDRASAITSRPRCSWRRRSSLGHQPTEQVQSHEERALFKTDEDVSVINRPSKCNHLPVTGVGCPFRKVSVINRPSKCNHPRGRLAANYQARVSVINRPSKCNHPGEPPMSKQSTRLGHQPTEQVQSLRGLESVS